MKDITDQDIEELVFFIFREDENEKWGDKLITEEIMDSMDININMRVVDYTEEFLREMNTCNFILGSRLHSGIVAYALDIPFILIEYHSKCTEFLNTINHNYRFDLSNYEINKENYNTLIKSGNVPGIVESGYFRGILIETLKKLEKII